MPGHYDRPKIRGGHGNTRRKSVHHGRMMNVGVMSTEPDIVDPCQELGSSCFTDTYGNCECYARTPNY